MTGVTVLFVLLIALLGLLIGSFLNVVIWRIPRGESIAQPPSACPGCEARIKPYDNIPVLSWLILRGKCRNCSQPISTRYPLIEATTAVLFGLSAWHFGLTWLLPAILFLAAISVALTMIDLDTHRLPNAIVLPAYPVTLVLLAVAALTAGHPGALLRAVIGGVILFTIYFVLLLIYPAGMGFGDVKLAGVLGMYLAYFGWGALAIGGFGAFLIGGLVSLVLLAARRVTRKSGIPFGPAMLLGAALGIIWGQPLWNAYLDLMI